MADLLFFRAGAGNKLDFGMTTTPELVRGIPALVQEVCVELLSDFRPDLGRGSGLSRDLSGIDSTDQAGAEQVVSDAVDAVVRHILERQAGNPTLTAEERLQGLTLVSVENQGTLSWKIDLELTPARGDSIVFTVPGTGNDPE